MSMNESGLAYTAALSLCQQLEIEHGDAQTPRIRARRRRAIQAAQFKEPRPCIDLKPWRRELRSRVGDRQRRDFRTANPDPDATHVTERLRGQMQSHARWLGSHDAEPRPLPHPAPSHRPTRAVAVRRPL